MMRLKRTSPLLKGVYRMNPTDAVMKSNGAAAIVGHGQDVRGFQKVALAGPRKNTKRKTK